MNSSTPLEKRIVLGLIGLLIIGVILVFFYIPALLFWRSIVSLGVQLKKGNTVATFDADSYVSGETVTIKIKTVAKEKLSTSKRVFVNLIQRNASYPMPSSTRGYRRVYLYSEFKDVTSEKLNSGVLFVLPVSIPGGQLTSAHLDKELIRYWEILVEEPKRLYWARFLFLVQ